MEKKEFVNLLNDIVKKYGYKKNGNNWFYETQTLKKVINLQRSNFGNYYYINYGWIIKALELKSINHVGGRFASLNKNENKRIDELLDLDNNINDEDRRAELYNLIVPNLLEKLQSINSEEELYTHIKSLEPPFSTMIPGYVKKYFNIFI